MSFRQEIFILILTTTCALNYGETEALNFSHHISLSSGLSIKWNSDDPEWITFQMSSPSHGYIAMGFSPTGVGMTGSDIYLGWVDSKGKGHLKVIDFNDELN